MTAAEKKKGISLPVKIIIGLISGTAWAVLSSIMGWSHFTLDWIAPFGDIFINLLKLIVQHNKWGQWSERHHQIGADRSRNDVALSGDYVHCCECGSGVGKHHPARKNGER